MTFYLLKLLALFALVAIPASAAPPAKRSPVANGQAGAVDTGKGWRIGSAKAPNALVEYGSLNCPHCAEFAKGAMPTIKRLVAAGKLSFEFRPKLIFPHDPAATILAHCAGPGRALGFVDDYLANAPAVMDRLRAAYRDQRPAFDAAEKAGAAAQLRFFADKGAMGPIAGRHGVSAQRAAACLADAKLQQRLMANEQAALAAGVKGTPTFFLNGKLADQSALEALGIPVAVHAH